MYDHNVVTTENYINDQCASEEQACHECAERNGIDEDMADNCDMGKFNCCGCPWGGSEAIVNAYRRHRESIGKNYD